MPGLIPLMLRPSEPTAKRGSVSFRPTHSRSASTGFVQPVRPALSKRLSQQVPAALTLPVIPYTQVEWRKAIAEVKRQHMSRRYRACSARCAEILDNLKDVSHVEPAYLIYLHFYAAASMEMCTRPLPLTSPYRTALLQQARTHYDRATTLIQAAENSVATKTRSGSVTSSCSSSLHSPSGSVSSRTWTADTSVPSPTNSICSSDELSTSQSSPRKACAPTKRVKKVSFSLPLCAEEEEETQAQIQERDHSAAANFRFPEPMIRPDSPTLGFDDEYFHFGAARRDLPLPPAPAQSSTSPLCVEELPLLPEETDEYEAEETGDNSRVVVERSVHRYNTTLAHLRSQLASHSRNLDAQLVHVAEMAAADSSAPSTPASPTFAAAALEKNADAGARAADKRARIERLRKNGWVRKRFDARRYEELAQEVLAELE